MHDGLVTGSAHVWARCVLCERNFFCLLSNKNVRRSHIRERGIHYAIFLEKKSMRTLGNILWFILGGAVMGLAWWLAGVLAFISIVGIPWGRACFVIGEFTFFPFGKEAVRRDVLNDRGDIGTGGLGLIGNVIWFLVAGFWLALGHLGAALLCFITIIGIPFGVQHIKLAALALAPVGKTIVSTDSRGVAGRGLF